MKQPYSAILLGSLAIASASSHANAALVTATSLFAPLVLTGTQTVVGVQGIATPSTASITGAGYSVDFSGSSSGEGVVQGTVPGLHATPVAGSSGSSPTYLTGDFGSSQTTNVASSGNYLAVSSGSITLGFTNTESAIEVLWGSVDFSNALTFYNGATNLGTVTGTAVEATPGFAGNGNQGVGGSSYVTINSSTPFTSVVATSGVTAFEFTGIVASSQPIQIVPVPEPVSLTLLGTGLIGLGIIRRRKT